MKWSAWWKGLLEDQQTKLASHSKLNALVGSAIASFIMLWEAIHSRMNAEYFWAYLGILVAGAGVSKWIGIKNKVKEKKNVDDITTDIPKE